MKKYKITKEMVFEILGTEQSDIDITDTDDMNKLVNDLNKKLGDTDFETYNDLKGRILLSMISDYGFTKTKDSEGKDVIKVIGFLNNSEKFKVSESFEEFVKDKKESKMSIGIEIVNYFIDAEWEGGSFKSIAAIPIYYLTDGERRENFFEIDNYIIEILSGRPPVDELDRIRMKSAMLDVEMYRIMYDFPLSGTYHKNLRINKLERVESNILSDEVR